MNEIIEIKPREWVVKMNGHQLRQHYFTLQSAQQVVRTMK